MTLAVPLAMQKVEGSSPFSRSRKKPREAGLFVVGAGARSAPRLTFLRSYYGITTRSGCIERNPSLNGTVSGSLAGLMLYGSRLAFSVVGRPSLRQRAPENPLEDLDRALSDVQHLVVHSQRQRRIGVPH